MIWIRSVYTGPVPNWNGTVPYGITFVSGPTCNQIADLIPTESTRSRVNTKLIRLYRFQTDPVPCKLCLIVAMYRVSQNNGPNFEA